MTEEGSAASTQAGIGTLNEGALHEALKRRYLTPGARMEQEVDGFVADVALGNRLIEIQTSGFSSLKRKLPQLLEKHPVTLVHPVARVRYIVKLPQEEDGQTTRRRSPRRGAVWDVFRELVYIPHLVGHPNLTLDIVLTEEEEIRVHDGTRAWRRKGWVVVGRRLVDVLETLTVRSMADLFAPLESELPDQFTTEDLARAMNRPRRIGQKAAYCLHAAGVVAIVGKRGNAIVYARAMR